MIYKRIRYPRLTSTHQSFVLFIKISFCYAEAIEVWRMTRNLDAVSMVPSSHVVVKGGANACY